MLGPFHLMAHARPVGVIAAQPASIDGRTLQALAVRPEALVTPLPVSFEQACAALEQIDRMFIEPDGSFVWRAGEAAQTWQLDGVLYDHAGQLMYVELKGTCPRVALEQLLAIFADSPTAAPQRLLLQMVQEGIVVEPCAFYALAR